MNPLPHPPAAVPKTLSCVRYESPVGPMLLVGDDDALTGLYFDAQKYFPPGIASRCTERETPLLAQARHQLDGYFAGRLTAFTLPCAPEGSAFQQAVWRAIAGVPFGETISYGELARRVDAEGVAAPGHGGEAWRNARAAGSATGRNPIGIVIPCHRIVGSDGSLTGYAGGLDRKLSLLQLEGVLPRSTTMATRQTRVQPRETREQRSLSLF